MQAGSPEADRKNEIKEIVISIISHGLLHSRIKTLNAHKRHSNSSVITPSI